MKINKKIRKNFIMLPTLATIVATPAIVVSCSFNISQGSLNYEQQTELIKSPEAKQMVFDTWVTETFTTLYSKKIIKSGDIQKTKKELIYFLENLKWQADASISKEAQEKFEKQVYNAYKFYVTFRSSVDTGEADFQTFNYFPKKAIEWKEKKYQTVGENPESLIQLNPKPGILETKDNLADWNSDKTYNLLFRARATGIYGNIMKLLIGEMYFLFSDAEEIKKGTNYNKETNNKTTKNYVDATSFNLDDGFYFMNKYLVTKTPEFKWTYSSDKSVTGQIKNYKDFNNFAGVTAKQLNKILTPLTSDKFLNPASIDNKDLSNLRSFTEIVFNSELTEGDVATNIDVLKTFGYEKSGLLNSENNLLFSFDNLLARQAISIMKQNQKIVGLPSIKIKDGSLNKSLKQISLKDIEMKFKNNTNTTYDETNDTLTLNDSANNQSWTITKLSFVPSSNSEDKKINLNVKYSFNDGTKDWVYWYNFDISNWDDTKKTQETIFQEEYYFTLSTDSNLDNKFVEYINPLNNDNKINFSYILRPLPIFEIQKSGVNYVEIGSSLHMLGKFSLENTIWSSKLDSNGVSQNDHEPKKTLIHWFILKDTTLWETIQDYYLFNDYNIEAQNNEVKSIVNEFKLTKKTTEDRKNAGIIF